MAVMAAAAGLLLDPFPADSTEFMADRLMKRDGRIYKGSLYCKVDRWRIEHNNAGPVDVTIVRKDKGVVWLLMARTRQFKTIPLDASSEPNCQHDLTRETARDPIGTEILEGHRRRFQRSPSGRETRMWPTMNGGPMTSNYRYGWPERMERGSCNTPT